MGKYVVVAVWVIVALALASRISGLQVGPGLGKDNMTIPEIFSEEDFNGFFPHTNDPLAHAQGFYDYHSFIVAASMFEKEGFGLTGGSAIQKREIAAFLAHAAHETSCGWSKALDGPFAWGLCYNQELSPPSIYCKQDLEYPCVNGVSYHGRGVFPVFYNFNYGTVGNALKLDLLHRPDWVASNATLAFATAMWLWVTPQKPNPSAHDVMVEKWIPTKNDLDNFRYPGFGMTINIINGQVECGHGDDPRADDRIDFYRTFAIDKLSLDNIGDNLDCGLQTMLPAGFTAVL